MSVNKTNPHSHEAFLIDKVKKLIEGHRRSHWKRPKEGKEFLTISNIPACQLTENKWMADNLGAQKQLL